MNSVGSARGDSLHDGHLVEVALLCGRRADPDGVVGLLDMQGLHVGIGVDGKRADAESASRLDHAAGDFAAVRDEERLEHRAVPTS